MKMILVQIFLSMFCVLVLSEDNTVAEENDEEAVESLRSKALDLYSTCVESVDLTAHQVQLLRAGTAATTTSMTATLDESKALYALFFSDRADRRRVAACTRQKTKLDVMRRHSAESIDRCCLRVGALLDELRSAAEKLKKDVQQCNTQQRPPHTSETKNCKDKLRRAIDSFAVYNTLKDFEAKMGLKFCQQVTSAYREVVADEENDLKKCIADGSDGKPTNIASNDKSKPTLQAPVINDEQTSN